MSQLTILGSADVHQIFRNYDKKDEKWMILGFSSESYIPIAKIWYDQLENLGYDNHFIVPTDQKAFDLLKNLSEDSGNGKTFTKSYRFKMPSKFVNSVRSGFWKMRIETIKNLMLTENSNIFISDVDSIWVNYMDLRNLPPLFDNFHAICGDHPKLAYKTWKFVLCGGVGGYRNSNQGKIFMDRLVKRCGENCDDQENLNEFYLRMGMKWDEIPGSLVKLGYVPPREPIYQKTKTGNTVEKINIPINVMTFNPNLVSRGHNWPYYHEKCSNVKERQNLWIISPDCHKKLKEKYKMFSNLTACFSEPVVDKWLTNKRVVHNQLV